MTTIRTVGGERSFARWEEALKIVSRAEVPDTGSRFYNSHRDTEDLRFIAERYRRRKRSQKDSTVSFELDQDGEMILVNIQDDIAGTLRLRMTPEQVERVLKALEETDDNEASLSSFFIDVKL